MKAYGKLDWAIAVGRIPFETNGREPELGSHDKLAILNTSREKAVVELWVFYEDDSPVIYEVEVEPNRVRKIRFNDLIEPEAIRMERNFSCQIKSNIPIVVQYSRLNTGAKANAEMTTMAYPIGVRESGMGD